MFSLTQLYLEHINKLELLIYILLEPYSEVFMDKCQGNV
jgi:hypothetical protein